MLTGDNERSGSCLFYLWICVRCTVIDYTVIDYTVIDYTAVVSCSMAVSRSKDVPTFGPAIPEGAVFTNSVEFKEFLLTKGVVFSFDNTLKPCAVVTWVMWSSG